MSSYSRKFKGWNCSVESPDNDDKSDVITPRRSRRTRQQQDSNSNTSALTDKITLERINDGLILQIGDCISVIQDGAQEKLVTVHCIITDIRIGISDPVEIIGLWFTSIDDIKNVPDYIKAKENEIYLTPASDKINFGDILDKINVYSKGEFEDITIDESNCKDTFMCRRATDESTKFSEEFDYREYETICKMTGPNFRKFIESKLFEKQEKEQTTEKTREGAKSRQQERKMKENKTLERASDFELSTSSSPQPRNGVNKPKFDRSKASTEEKRLRLEAIMAKSNKGQERKERGSANVINIDDDDDIIEKHVEDNAASSDVSDQQQQQSDHEPDVEEIESSGDDEDDEFESDYDEKPKRRSVSRKSPSKSIPTTPKKSKNHNLYAALTPTKRFKIIQEDDDSKLHQKLSPTKKRKIVALTDPTSEAFKEMRAKLHTSQKLNALPGREKEFDFIFMNIQDSIRYQTGCCIYASGVPGMGKTATIKDAIEQLQEFEKFEFLELNGLRLLTPTIAYEILWKKISGGDKVSSTNAAILLEEYFKNEDKKRKPLVILMDELDQIAHAQKKQDVMYNFFNWPTYEHSKLIVIAVANTMDLPERNLSNKISSRLGLRRIQFKGYTFDQLAKIIEHRLEMISRTHKKKVIIKKDAIGFAARKVASVSGDARRALNICRKAVEIAEIEHSNKDSNDDLKPCEVLISHIAKAIKETINSPLSKFVSGLPYASKLFLASALLRIRRSGLAINELGDIIDEMKNNLTLSNEKDTFDLLFKNSNGFRILHFQQIVKSLVESGIILTNNAQFERSKLIDLNGNDEEISSVLKNDNELCKSIEL
ncbi:unnamed protein product [Candida verbasci]|uniref:Origin recognition complex subunit 1 n=1 Tax=Candida verbasci TaxID=1227364 RepID=A0A9W4XAU7_9ASCO|nr:unnamed protein product [Candida verbasci]